MHEILPIIENYQDKHAADIENASTTSWTTVLRNSR